MTTLPNKRGVGPTYEHLAAKMREAPTFAVAEETIRKDYPLKLPSRRSIQLWNTPEISQFRGYQEDLDAEEEHRAQHTRESLEIRDAAREAGTHLTDMDIVHQMMAHQRQQQTALQQHLSGLSDLNRQQMEGMAAEQRAELIRLGTAQQEAANRAAMAEQALVSLRDVSLEHRNMLGQLAQQQGVVQHNIDNRHTSTTIVHQNVDQELHRRAMDMLRTHADQFGQYMHQQNLNAEQMQRLLYMHLMRNQTPAPVIHILPRPLDEERPTPMEITPYGGGGPPPPPGGAGAAMKVRKQGKKKEARPINITYGTGPPPPAPPAPTPPPAPVPEAIPNIPAGVPHFHIGSPPPAARRARTPRPPRARPTPPLVPWQSGAENPPALPPAPAAAVPAQEKRASEQESQEAPAAVRARAKTRSRGASVRASSAATVLYEGDQPVLRAAPKRRGRPPSTPAVVLPTHEAANQHEQEQMAEASRRGREKAVKARLLANAAKYQRPSAKARAASAPPAPETIPEAAPPVKKPSVRKAAITESLPIAEKKPRGRPRKNIVIKPAEEKPIESEKTPSVVKKVRIRKVAIQSSDLKDTIAKRGRGRPRGSLGVKKRNALLEEELRRMTAVAA